MYKAAVQEDLTPPTEAYLPNTASLGTRPGEGKDA
jgi:hypothetical protein